MKKSAWVVMSCVLAVSMMSSGCRKNPKPPTDTVMDDPYGPTSTTEGRIGESGTLIENLNLAPVYFGFDSFLLAPAEMGKVQAAAAYLQQNPSVHCVIEGNCDERGTHEYNMALGQSRADAVRAAIVGAGISADRVEAKSMGEEKPFSPEHDESAWSANRRGEFMMYQ